MGLLTIPADGMTLVGSHASNTVENPSKSAGQPVQVMRLDLAPGMLNEILKSSVNNKKKMHISFGRVVVSSFPISTQRPVADCPFCEDAALRQ